MQLFTRLIRSQPKYVCGEIRRCAPSAVRFLSFLLALLMRHTASVPVRLTDVVPTLSLRCTLYHSAFAGLAWAWPLLVLVPLLIRRHITMMDGDRHPLLIRSDARVAQACAVDSVQRRLFRSMPSFGTSLKTAVLNSVWREMRLSFSPAEGRPALTLALDCWSEFVTSGAMLSWHALQQCPEGSTFPGLRAAALDGFGEDVVTRATNRGRVTAVELINHAETW
jgi:hypothetical protein